MTVRYTMIVFEDNKNKEHRILYELFNTSLAKRWVEVIAENKKDKEKYIHSTLYNLSGADIPRLHNEIILTCRQINVEYDDPLPIYSVDSVLTYQQLNLLHSLFEKWGDRIPELEAAGRHTRSSMDNFLRLNELIHSYELALGNSTRLFPSMHACADYYPQTIFRDIDPIDKLHVSNWYDWGDLYLGYNTLGKEWLTVASGNDIEVLLRDNVRPQQRFAAELWISFYERNRTAVDTTASFEKWYLGLAPDLKEMVPIKELSNMVLGKFIIGKIVIDNYFLGFDSKKSNWLMPNHEVKKKWNLEVFSTFQKVKDIILV